MAVNKVIFGNVTLIDTSEVTVTPDKMFKGETALGADGEMQTGTFTIAEELSEQDALLTELETVLAGKAAGGGSAPVLQEKTVDPSSFSEQIVEPDEGYDGLSKVAVKQIRLQEAEVRPSTEDIEVTPSADYHGLSKVIVKGITGGASSFPTCTVNFDATADLNMVVINGVFCWLDAENIVPCGDLNVIHAFVENARSIEDICFDVTDTNGYAESYYMNELVYNDYNDRIYGMFEGLAAGAHVTVRLVMAE